VTYDDMWRVCSRVAILMDDANYDWHRLFAIEDTLWPLATDLTATVSGARVMNTDDIRRAESHLRLVTTSLTWVRRHRCDALETDMQRHLDVALRSVIDALDRLQAVGQHAVAQ
jgi:hypothetical protein